MKKCYENGFDVASAEIWDCLDCKEKKTCVGNRVMGIKGKIVVTLCTLAILFAVFKIVALLIW